MQIKPNLILDEHKIRGKNPPSDRAQKLQMVRFTDLAANRVQGGGAAANGFFWAAEIRKEL